MEKVNCFFFLLFLTLTYSGLVSRVYRFCNMTYQRFSALVVSV